MKGRVPKRLLCLPDMPHSAQPCSSMTHHWTKQFFVLFHSLQLALLSSLRPSRDKVDTRSTAPSLLEAAGLSILFSMNPADKHLSSRSLGLSGVRRSRNCDGKYSRSLQVCQEPLAQYLANPKDLWHSTGNTFSPACHICVPGGETMTSHKQAAA